MCWRFAPAFVALLLPIAGSAEPSDGRLPLAELASRFESLVVRHDWKTDSVFAYPDDDALSIRAFRTPQQGEALWILAGIHGEEPAGPNAIARNLERIVELAGDGVPVVLLPLCNPKAYGNNWRYPNTPERDWRRGGYSVGDAEHLLPDLEGGSGPRSSAPPGPETRALTQYVLDLAKVYPPRLVLDLHEDELSTAGGYVYSQGVKPDANPVVEKVIETLQSSGIPIRLDGRTRFGEPIVDGVISRDDSGGPVRDGSIDELLAARNVFVDGKLTAGPSAPTVIVVETPAFAGAKLDLRVAAQGAVLQRLPELWSVAPGK
jgi:hypothetical protein